jgi:lipopolysaccharide transport system ATP-binding protein
MYVRLAFAVAAHLEPEILIVDEVLAVGDAQFQKKCLGKMDDVSKEGRTVIFVSHNMGAIEQLCKKVALLENGGIKKFSSNIKDIIGDYLFEGKTNEMNLEWRNNENKYINIYFTPHCMSLVNGAGNKIESSIINKEDSVWITIEGYIEELNSLLTIGYALYYENELLYWSYPTDISEQNWIKLSSGLFQQTSEIPVSILNIGKYRIEMIGGIHGKKWLLEPNTSVPSMSFIIEGKPSDSPYWNSRRPGMIAPLLQWNIDKTNQINEDSL